MRTKQEKIEIEIEKCFHLLYYCDHDIELILAKYLSKKYYYRPDTFEFAKFFTYYWNCDGKTLFEAKNNITFSNKIDEKYLKKYYALVEKKRKQWVKIMDFDECHATTPYAEYYTSYDELMEVRKGEFEDDFDDFS